MEAPRKQLIKFVQFKIHERFLKSTKMSFEQKIVTIMNVWGDIAATQFIPSDIIQIREIVEWAKLHSLNIVLQSEWNQLKVIYQLKLTNRICKAVKNLSDLSVGFVKPLNKLVDVVLNPWENSILLKLMKDSTEIGPEEANFFYTDTIYVITLRLKKLCENYCEDLALNLCTAFLKLRASNFVVQEQLKMTVHQFWFIFDLNVALLYKFEKFPEMFLQLKKLTIQESLNLVQRFSTKKINLMKIWKYCYKIACIALQLYITKIVLNAEQSETAFLEDFLEMYLKLCSKNQILEDFLNFIKRICTLGNSDNLHSICEVILKSNDSNLKTLLLEIYIRILTIDINALESYKNDQKWEEIQSISSKLALTYDKLAEIFTNLKLTRECILTSFCLHPTKERLLMLENIATRSGFHVEVANNWKCSLHPPVFSTDEIMWKCPQCNDWMCKPQLNIQVEKCLPLNETIQHTELGISQTLCDDLIVCLSYSRYQVLSWVLPWNELHRLCAMYLQNPAATKNFITELKYVDIDYSMFRNIKKEPLDDLAGIERGYEHYLDCNLLYNNVQWKSVRKGQESSKAAKKPGNLKQFLTEANPVHVTADFQSPRIVLQKLPELECKQVEKSEQRKDRNLEVMRMKLMIKLRRENIVVDNGVKK